MNSTDDMQGDIGRGTWVTKEFKDTFPVPKWLMQFLVEIFMKQNPFLYGWVEDRTMALFGTYINSDYFQIFCRFCYWFF